MKVIFLGCTKFSKSILEHLIDFSGGVENGFFYLKNCGFTNDRTTISTKLERQKTNIAPKIIFDSLE